MDFCPTNWIHTSSLELYRSYVDQPGEEHDDADAERDASLVPVGALIADDGDYAAGKASHGAWKYVLV